MCVEMWMDGMVVAGREGTCLVFLLGRSHLHHLFVIVIGEGQSLCFDGLSDDPFSSGGTKDGDLQSTNKIHDVKNALECI